MLIAIILFAFAILCMVWAVVLVARKPKTVGEKLANKYIKEHERKVADDKVYQQYLDWCQFHGEVPMDKKGFYFLRKKDKEHEEKMKKALDID